MLSDKIEVILWDWNGTLLNDIDICVNSINQLLQAREKPAITIEKYREIFTFPVREYYLKAGFDFTSEPFEKPAEEFVDIYYKYSFNAKLFDDAIDILEFFRSQRISQNIISAMRQNELNFMIKEVFKIGAYFDKIAGITDHYANGKNEAAKKLICNLGINPSCLLLIGDTVHDHEVAAENNCKCILVANGHQSESRLKATGNTTLKDLEELRNYLHKNQFSSSKV